MNRRGFLCDTGAVALGAAWRADPLAFALALCGPRARAGTALGAASAVVFDPALAEGRSLARQAASAGCIAWAVGDRAGDGVGVGVEGDIGGLWHAQLSRQLAPGATLIGSLRPSDRFVLARLAATRHVTLRDFASAGHATPVKSDSRGCAYRT